MGGGVLGSATVLAEIEIKFIMLAISPCNNILKQPQAGSCSFFPLTGTLWARDGVRGSAMFQSWYFLTRTDNKHYLGFYLMWKQDGKYLLTTANMKIYCFTVSKPSEILIS